MTRSTRPRTRYLSRTVLPPPPDDVPEPPLEPEVDPPPDDVPEPEPEFEPELEPAPELELVPVLEPVALSCWPTVRLTAVTVPVIGDVRVAPARAACASVNCAWATLMLAWSAVICAAE